MLTKEQFIECITSPRGDFAQFQRTFSSDISRLGGAQREAFDRQVMQLIEQSWQDYYESMEKVHHLVPPLSSADEQSLLQSKHLPDTPAGKDIAYINILTDAMVRLKTALLGSLEEKITKADRSWGVFVKKNLNIHEELLDMSHMHMNTASSEALAQAINIPWMKAKTFFGKTYIDMYGTPLTIAVSNTESLPALFFINQGADVNKYALSFGNNPLLLAVSKGWNHSDNEVQSGDMSAFAKLGRESKQKDIIQRLLEVPTLDVNAQHLGNGMTALHIACLRGDDPELIQGLINKGADLRRVDYQGRTPLDCLNISYTEARQMTNRLAGIRPEIHGEANTLSTLPSPAERERNIRNNHELITTHLRESSRSTYNRWKEAAQKIREDDIDADVHHTPISKP